MSSDDVLTVPGPVQLQLRTALVLEQAPILRWRFLLGVVGEDYYNLLRIYIGFIKAAELTSNS